MVLVQRCFKYLLFPFLGVCCKINTLGLQSITQLFGNQTFLQSFVCLRIDKITSGIDEESKKSHRHAIFIEEQVRVRAKGQNKTSVVRGQFSYQKTVQHPCTGL